VLLLSVSVLAKRLLLTHLVNTSHSALVVDVLLLLAHGLCSSEWNALTVHLTLLLSGSPLHEESLHHLPITRVDKATTAMTGREWPLVLAHLMHLLWLLLILLRINRLLAVLTCERRLWHLQALIKLIGTILS